MIPIKKAFAKFTMLNAFPNSSLISDDKFLRNQSKIINEVHDDTYCGLLLFSKLQNLWPCTVAASLMQVDRDFFVLTSARILRRCTVAQNGTM